VLNALILSIDRYVGANHDLEFSTFSTVLYTVKYSLAWGFAAAILTKLADIIYNKNPCIDDVFSVGAYMIAGFLASLVPTAPLSIMGPIIVLMLQVYYYFTSKYLAGVSLPEIFMQTLTNVILNFILFINLSDFFYKLI